MSLELIAKLSNIYGSDPDYVLAGGGNTSFKDEKYLYVKPSGVSLAAITERDFVKMDRSIVRSCFTLDNFSSVAEREAKVKKLMDYTSRGGDVADPWYTGNFAATYLDISEACLGLFDSLK